MAAVDRELGIFHSVHVYRLLLSANGGRGLYGHAPHDGCAGRNAAQDAAGIIGLDLDIAGLGVDAIRIVVLAASHGGDGKAHAKLHALYGGNPKRDLRDAVLDAVEHRVADARGQAVDAALHDAADAVELIARGKDLLAHATGSCGVNARQVVRKDRLAVGLAIDHVVHGQIGDATDLRHVRHHVNAAGLERLQRDAAGDA